LGKEGIKYIIYKISDDLKEVVVDEVSKDADYDVFREKLQNAKEKNGKSRPSYAVYDVAFDLDGGEGHRLAGWSRMRPPKRTDTRQKSHHLHYLHGP
jgi:cofilin